MQISNQSIESNQENYGPVSIFQNSSKNLIVACMINLKITLRRYYQNISAELEKGSAHNIAY